MADPAGFFSTLAQSIAVIIGFSIAIFVGLFQLERGRRRRRTEEVREELIDLRSKYRKPLSSINAIFSQIKRMADDPTRDFRDEFLEGNISSNELRNEVFEKNDFNCPHVYLMECHTGRVSKYIYGISESEDPTQHYLLSKDQIEMVKESSNIISGALLIGNREVDGWPDNGTERLFNEISDETENLGEEQSGEYANQIHNFIEKEIEDSDIGSPNKTIDHLHSVFDVTILQPVFPSERFAQHFRKIDKFLRNNYQGNTFGDNNLISIGNVYDELDRDINKIDSVLGDTILYHEMNIKHTIGALVSLLVFGVFIPIASLIPTPFDVFPFSIINENIIIYQSFLLVIAVAIILYLTYLLFNDMIDLLTR